MVVLDKYHDVDQIIATDPSSIGDTSDHDHDAPPSYETIASTSRPGQSSNTPNGAHIVLDEKPSRHSATFSSSNSTIVQPTSPGPGPGPSQPKQSTSSWLSVLSFAAGSSRPSRQVRQTVSTLLRDLVLNPHSPNLLSSCAEACRTYNIDFSALLQDPFIEHHSPVYWAIVNKKEERVIEEMTGYAVPLSQSAMSEVRLACLTTSNQGLFQALRTQGGPFANHKAPLSSNSGADVLVLGSTPADELSVQEVKGEGAFVVDMKFHLWQKRMRVSGRVTAEFIARGRIWSLTFFSAPQTRNAIAGSWQVALCLLEHSPPTFIDSRLVVDIPPTPQPPSSQTNDLISLSPPPDESTSPSSSPAGKSPVSSPLWLSSHTKSKSKTDKNIQVRIKSSNVSRLAYNPSHPFPSTLQHAFSNRDAPWPPKVVSWYGRDDERHYTNALVVQLEQDMGRGAELMYDNTPFIGEDGTLRIRLEAKLAKPQGPDCVIC